MNDDIDETEKQIPVLLVSEPDPLKVLARLGEPLVGGDRERLARRAANEYSRERPVNNSFKLLNNLLDLRHVPVLIGRTEDSLGWPVRTQRPAEDLVEFESRLVR